MNARYPSLPLRATVIAAQGAVLALALLASAQAQTDTSVADLVQPTSSIELGLGNTSKPAQPYQYTGLEHEGVFIDGSLDLRGGGAYDSNDTTRWRLVGTNLGTQSRELSGEVGEQGRFRINFDFSQLLHVTANSYETPLLGVGTSNLTLPSSWVTPTVPLAGATTVNSRGLSSAVTSSPYYTAKTGLTAMPNAAQLATAAQEQNADLPLFHNVELSTKRTDYKFGGGFDLDHQWTASASFDHEDKQGLQALGTVNSSLSEISMVIPNLIDQSTDQINAGVAYHHDKVNFEAKYYGSLYSDHVNGMTWPNWDTLSASTPQTTSSPPSNQFHQLTLSGSYAFTRDTKLVADTSYSRNTQNTAYETNYYSAAPAGVSSLGGLVENKTLDLKLTSKASKDLNFTAGYKYNARDDKTAVGIYNFSDAGGAFSTSPNTLFPGYYGTNINANRPYSKTINDANVGADYRFASGENLKAGFDASDSHYYCSGSWIDCAQVDHVRENTFNLDWINKASDDLQTRLGFSHGVRTVNYNPDAWLALVPAAGWVASGQTTSLYQYMLSQGWPGGGGWGPMEGYQASMATNPFFVNGGPLTKALIGNTNNVIAEVPGLESYDADNRTRNKIRASSNWQASDKWSVQGGLDFTRDNYPNNAYGLLKSESWALNLEGDYAASETLSLSGYYTHEDLRSKSAGDGISAPSNTTNVQGATLVSGGCYSTVQAKNNNADIDPCLQWGYDMADRVDTLGFAAADKGLMHGRLDLRGDISFSLGRTTNDVSGGSYVQNPALAATNPANTIAYYYTAAQNYPLIVSRTIDVKLSAKYAINKQSSLRFGYRYQRLFSNDYLYNGFQVGSTPTAVLPTYQTSPVYTVQTVVLAYIYNF